MATKKTKGRPKKSEGVELSATEKRKMEKTEAKKKSDEFRNDIGDFLYKNFAEAQDIFDRVKQDNPAECLRFLNNMAKLYLPTQQSVSVDNSAEKAQKDWMAKIHKLSKSQNE